MARIVLVICSLLFAHMAYAESPNAYANLQPNLPICADNNKLPTSTCPALGTMSGQNANSVTITGGTITGIVGLSPTLPGTTGSIGGGILLAGACTSGTVAVTNSTTAMSVVATPVTYPGDGVTWAGYVSTAGTVTVKVCAIVGLTPGATAYNVRVIQ